MTLKAKPGLRAASFAVCLAMGQIFVIFIGSELAFSASASAQNAAEDASAKANEKQARATLAAMVQALGGDRWVNLKDASFDGRTSGFYQGQPTGGIGDYFDFKRFPDKERIEFGKKRDVAEFFLGDQGWEVTYRGKKMLPQDQIDDYVRRRDHSIETVMRVWMKDPKTIVIYDKQSLVERHLADQVTLFNADNDSITIQTDAQTHLPLRRTFQWRDPVYKDKNEEADEYDDYHTIDGIPTPFTTTRFHNGDMTSQRYLYRASYNVSFPDSMFDVDASVAKIKK